MAFIGVVAVLGFLEISRLMEKKGVWISRPFGIFSVILILSGAFLDREFGTFLAFVVSFIFILLIRLSRNVESALQDAAMMALGIFYTGGLASFAVLLREYPGNFWGIDPGYLTFFLFASVWTADTLSYFVGCGFGRHKLIPRVSPGKSFEGTLGGILGSIAISLGLGVLWWNGPIVHFVILGIIVAASDQLGDLVESMFKRDTGVKDTSGIIPGHGGILDRFDGFLLTAPLVYLYLLYFSEVR